MPNIIRRKEMNCTAKGGPSKCRYHSKQYKKHPQAGQFKSFEDIFVAVEKQIKPSEIIYASVTANERATRKVDYLMESRVREAALNKDQRHALFSYSDSYGSNNVRLVLMNPDKNYQWNDDNSERVHRRVQLIDSVIEDHGEDLSSTVLWRGVQSLSYELEDVSLGKVITFPSYMSTSSDLETALSFSSKNAPVLLRIEARKGFRMVGYHATEEEVLLPHGLNFKVVKIQENVSVEKVGSHAGFVPGVTILSLQEV